MAIHSSRSLLVMMMATLVFLPSLSFTTTAAALQITMMTKTSPSTSSASWRIALNIGRERFTSMPSNWASSGARLPIVLKCNFTDSGEILPLDGEVCFTGARGEVVKPITKGNWSLENNRDLSFTLTFPESMTRNDVTLEACTITCTGLLYTVQDLKDLNSKFYEARDKTDDAAKVVNDISRKRTAPKKWDKEQNKWVKRYKEDSIFSNLAKRLRLVGAAMEEKQKSNQRPKNTILSVESGPFPGIDCEVFITKGGTIKMTGGKWGDAVIGTWAAEPITDRSASYFRPTY